MKGSDGNNSRFENSWIVDMDGNLQMDAHDVLFALGDSGDLPVVGDWDGDGIDDPGIYRPEAPADGPAGDQ